MPDGAATLLLAARLLPFKKPNDPQGVRPIAVGEVLRRLVGKFLLGSCMTATRKYLPPLQCGVGVPDAVPHIIHSMRQAYRKCTQDSTMGILQVDVTNAFNTLCRTSVLQTISTRFPSIHPWVTWLLTSSAPLLYEQREWQSTTGVQQGDPLGPFLFACSIHPILQALQEKFPDVYQKWYLDDGILHGPLVSLDAALQLVSQELQKWGSR